MTLEVASRLCYFCDGESLGSRREMKTQNHAGGRVLYSFPLMYHFSSQGGFISLTLWKTPRQVNPKVIKCEVR